MKQHLSGSKHASNLAKKGPRLVVNTQKLFQNIPQVEIKLYKPQSEQKGINVDPTTRDIVALELAASGGVDLDLGPMTDSDIKVNFKYNKTFIELLKTHIPGRTWDVSAKGWKVPGYSLASLVELLQQLKIRVPKRAMDALKLQQNNSKFDLASCITITRDNRTGYSSVRVSCIYNFAIVARLKEIHPRQRDYNPDTKIWTIDTTALPQFLDGLGSDGYIIDPSVHELVDTMIMQILDDQAPKELPVLSQEVPAPSPISTKPTPSTQSTQSTQSIFGSSSYSYSTSVDYSLYLPRRNQRELHPCPDCGIPTEYSQIHGEHVCRFYGTYKCQCGNSWSSGWTWKGEAQACRACGAEKMPDTTRKLQKRQSDNTTGPHDSERCGMCRRLGTMCNFER